jgi:hypothetical protein
MQASDAAAEAAARVERRLREAVDIVSRWGAVRTGAGRTVAEALHVDGVSWWDVGSIELALYRVPPLLDVGSGSAGVRARLRPYLSRIRRLGQRPWREPAGPTPPAIALGGALCVAFSPYMARDVVQPVAEALLSRGGPLPLLLTTDAERDAVMGGPRRPVAAYWDDAARDDALRLRAGLIAAARELLSRETLDGIRDAAPARARAHVGGVLHWFVHSLLPPLVVMAACARRVIAIERPSVVITADGADTRSRLVTLLARAIGAPTFELQFGACGGEATEWSFALGEHIGVWGAQARATLMSHGVDAARIVETGSPRNDALVTADGQALRDVWRVEPGERVVLFVSTYHLAAYEASVSRDTLPAVKRAVVAAAAATPGVLLVVKPHPLEGGAWDDFDGGTRFRVADRTEDIRPLVAAADAVVTLGSTVTLDALVAGKAVICPEFADWPYSVLFTRSGAVAVPRDEQQLALAFASVMTDGGAALRAAHQADAERFVRHWLRDNAGHASAEVAALVAAAAGYQTPATLTCTQSPS